MRLNSYKYSRNDKFLLEQEAIKLTNSSIIYENCIHKNGRHIILELNEPNVNTVRRNYQNILIYRCGLQVEDSKTPKLLQALGAAGYIASDNILNKVYNLKTMRYEYSATYFRNCSWFELLPLKYGSNYINSVELFSLYNNATALYIHPMYIKHPNYRLCIELLSYIAIAAATYRPKNNSAVSVIINHDKTSDVRLYVIRHNNYSDNSIKTDPKLKQLAERVLTMTNSWTENIYFSRFNLPAENLLMIAKMRKDNEQNLKYI